MRSGPTFLLRLDPPEGDGPTVAVKDMIDVAGTPTTAGCRPVAEAAVPVERDADCVRAVRENGGRIVGKTNMHELAFGGTGINPYTGTPVNPLDPDRIPGGSSSGSAVAVATGEADVALGTDTGGSIRTPAACCGVVGLKTTFGRIPLRGVRPLAPSLDTVGPLAATVDGIVTGMRLLEPGFTPSSPPTTVGRFYMPGTDPSIDRAIDAALSATGLAVSECGLDGWLAADRAGTAVAFAEAAEVNAGLLAHHADALGHETRERLRRGASLSAGEVRAAHELAPRWRDELDQALNSHGVIATSAVLAEPPLLRHATVLDTRRPNVAVNLAGHPAIAVPIARPGHYPTAVQLIGRRGDEETLVATARLVEHIFRTEHVPS